MLARVQPVELALNDLRGDLSSAEAVEHVLNLRKRAQMGKCIERADLFSYSKTTQNNEVELFMDRAYFTKGLLPAIHRAEDSIHLAMLAFDGGEFASYVADKLIEKKRQNPKLKIRIIADDFGSGAILPWSRARRNLNLMRKAGIEVVINSMFFNGLEHRKVLIVDGKEGYFGGACVSDPYFGNDNYWKAYGKIAKNDREAAREAIFNPVPGAAPLFEVTPDMALPDFHDFDVLQSFGPQRSVTAKLAARAVAADPFEKRR